MAHSSWFIAAAVSLAGALDAHASEPRVLVDDSFSDGSYTDGTDPGDVTWQWTGGDAFLSVVSDPALDPDGPGQRVLKAEDLSERDEYLSASFDPVTLEVGQTLRFSGRARLGQPPRDGLARFGAALLATSNLWQADAYSVNMNLGEPQPGKPDLRLLRDVNTQPANLNTQDVTLGMSEGYAGRVGDKSFAFVFAVRRVDEKTVEVSFQLDDRKAARVLDRGDSPAGDALIRFQKLAWRTDQADQATGGVFLFDQLRLEILGTDSDAAGR